MKRVPSAPTPLFSAEEEKLLRESVVYLNLEEMGAFCRAHDLSTFIHIARPTGSLKRTSDRDRKDIVLERILALALESKRLGRRSMGATSSPRSRCRPG